MVLICLVNCFTFSLANFPPFRVWHFHGLFFYSHFSIDTCLRTTSVHRLDDSTHESPLPLLITCVHSTFSIDVSLLLSTCILSIDACLSATSVHGSDDSSQSPLPNACTHSTFSIVARLRFGIFSMLIVATCLDAHGARGLDDFVYNNLVPIVCNLSATFTLAFALVLLLLLRGLSITDSTLIWLFSSLCNAMAGCLSQSEGHFVVSLLLFSMECFSSRL